MKRQWAVVVVLLVLLAGATVSAEPRVQDMEFKDASVVDVFQVLGDVAGRNVLVDPSVSGTVSFYLQDLSVTEALDLVAKSTGYSYQLVGNTLVVASKERLEDEFSTRGSAFVRVRHVDVSEVRSLLGVVQPDLQVYADQNRGLLVLHGRDADIDSARNMISQYDQEVPQETVADRPDAPETTYPRFSIAVEYGDGAGIVRQLAQAFPEGEYQWKEDVGLIHAWMPEEQQREAQAWAQQQDVPAFAIKGIVRKEDTRVVLVDYEGTTDRVRLGGNLIGWTIVDVDGRDVRFEKDGRSFTAAMGR